MDTSLIDVDVHPTYVSVVIKGKVAGSYISEFAIALLYPNFTASASSSSRGGEIWRGRLSSL